MMYGNFTDQRPFRLNAVFFDFDGTLTQAGALDFSVIKQKLGCPQELPVLEYIEGISDPVQREKAFAALNEFESEGAANSAPNPGAEDLLAHIRSKGLPIALITRNSLESVKAALKNFQHTDLSDFDIIITRDVPVLPKPSAEGVLLAARKLGIEPDTILMVGDYLFDIQAGRCAGAVTVHLDVESSFDKTHVGSDFTVSNLSDIQSIIRMGIPLGQGKLPNDMLQNFLTWFRIEDAALLIRPSVGEDIAAADISRDEVLILKSDPITFATDAIGKYAVAVNANDLATAGAVPRWFITTLLFPVGSTGSKIWHVMKELNEVSQKSGIILCGGHTEITDAVTRPVVIGSMAGTVTKKRLIDKRNLRQGDKVLLTKSVAVEGTAIIAREFEEDLRYKGFTDSEITECKNFLDHISIVKEAAIACDIGGVSAMHDVTEGGLSTAVMELSIAGRHRIRIDMQSVPIFEQTRRLCRVLGLSPLGLIGSGSLLICCRPEKKEALIQAIRNAGISATCIGEIMEKGQGVVARQKSESIQWPAFEVDELARLFATQVSALSQNRSKPSPKTTGTE
jgi:HAD superfamily hydrolase (TIGR01509 family)